MHHKQRYRDLFRQALRIRLVEEKIIELYPFDKIQSPVHLSIGQEAVAVGVCEALHREDLVFITYRGHAFYLAKGGDLRLMMAELYGRANGVSKGKAGSMHLAAFLGCRTLALSRCSNILEWLPPGVTALSSPSAPRGYRPIPSYWSDRTLPDWPSPKEITACVTC